MTRTCDQDLGVEGVRVEIVAGSPPDLRAVRGRLANGLTLLAMEDHSAPVVAVQVWMRVGSAREDPGRTGLAHLLEHLMFKGTPKHPKGVFDRLLERAGAQSNAVTSFDCTTYYETLPANHLDLALHLEADRLMNLALDSLSFEREREVVRSERSFRVEDDPDGHLEEVLYGLLFPGHPYGRPVLGVPEDLDRLTVGDCIEFHRRWYGPSQAVLVIAGDLEWPRIARAVTRHFGPIPGPSEAAPPPGTEGLPPAPPGRREVVRLPLQAERLRIGWRTVPVGRDDVFPLEFLHVVLFSNEASRVHHRLVEKEGLASQVEGASDPMALDGAFWVDVALNRGARAREAWRVIREEIVRLAREGPRPSEMRRARNHLETAFRRSMASAESRATQMGAFEVTAGDFRRAFRFVEFLARVTPEDVRQAAARWLDPDRAVMVVGRPG